MEVIKSFEDLWAMKLEVDLLKNFFNVFSSFSKVGYLIFFFTLA